MSVSPTSSSLSPRGRGPRGEGGHGEGVGVRGKMPPTHPAKPNSARGSVHGVWDLRPPRRAIPMMPPLPPASTGCPVARRHCIMQRAGGHPVTLTGSTGMPLPTQPGPVVPGSALGTVPSGGPGDVTRRGVARKQSPHTGHKPCVLWALINPGAGTTRSLPQGTQ